MFLAVLAVHAPSTFRIPIPPPEAYIRTVDQRRARLRDPEHIPCVEKGREHGQEVNLSRPTELCVKMLPSQRMRGAWRDGFEWSEFYPNAKDCSVIRRGNSIWLNPRNSGLKSRYTERGYSGCVLVDIIGRRTRFAGPYGHMGMFSHELIVERLITARVLPFRSSARR